MPRSPRTAGAAWWRWWKRRASRSRRPRPPRTWRSRLPISGSRAGGRPSEEQRRDLSCLAGSLLAPPHTARQMLSDDDHERCCEVRARTGWGPRLVGSEVGIPHATVHRALRRRGCSRRPRQPRGSVIRYEWPCPGNLLHMDTKRHARFVEPGHAVTGRRTRARAGRLGVRPHPATTTAPGLPTRRSTTTSGPQTVTAFTRRALDWFLERGIVAERLLTDNAWVYVEEQRPAPAAGRAGDRPLAHQALLARRRTEGGAPAADHGSRVGSGSPLPLKRRPSGCPATLARPLQREPSSLSSRQPPAHGSRSGRLGARQLAP